MFHPIRVSHDFDVLVLSDAFSRQPFLNVETRFREVFEWGVIIQRSLLHNQCTTEYTSSLSTWMARRGTAEEPVLARRVQRFSHTFRGPRSPGAGVKDKTGGNLFDVSFSIGGKSRTFLTSPSALTTSLILGCGVPRECKNRVVKNVASFWRAWTAPGVRAWKSLAGSDRLAIGLFQEDSPSGRIDDAGSRSSPSAPFSSWPLRFHGEAGAAFPCESAAPLPVGSDAR